MFRSLSVVRSSPRVVLSIRNAATKRHEFSPALRNVVGLSDGSYQDGFREVMAYAKSYKLPTVKGIPPKYNADPKLEALIGKSQFSAADVRAVLKNHIAKTKKERTVSKHLAELYGNPKLTFAEAVNLVWTDIKATGSYNNETKKYILAGKPKELLQVDDLKNTELFGKLSQQFNTEEVLVKPWESISK